MCRASGRRLWRTTAQRVLSAGCRPMPAVVWCLIWGRPSNWMACHIQSRSYCCLPVRWRTASPGAQLAGIRFQPGVCAAVFESQTAQPVATDNLSHNLQALANSLRRMCASGPCLHTARIHALRTWIDDGFDFTQRVPSALIAASRSLQQLNTSDITTSEHSVSPRQMERLFKRWLGISPKRYQRVLRVQSSVDDLKKNPELALVELALQQGFSDQAHMTREFKQIAKTTPKRYRQLHSDSKPKSD